MPKYPRYSVFCSVASTVSADPTRRAHASAAGDLIVQYGNLPDRYTDSLQDATSLADRFIADVQEQAPTVEAKAIVVDRESDDPDTYFTSHRP